MTLAEYLAKNYLTADVQPGKKEKAKKRRKKNPDAGLTIADDDISGWGKDGGGDVGQSDEDPDDENRPLNVSSTSATGSFRRAKSSTWQTIGTPAPSSSEQAAADAILTSTARENAARGQIDAGEEAPAIVSAEGIDSTAINKMESGAHAGLQSAAAVTAQLEQRRREERERWKAEERAEAAAKKGSSSSAAGKQQETIYRDASGRIINVAMKRAEARQAAEAEERKKRDAQEALKGDVQRREAQQRRDELKDAKFLTVARYADDKELNDELKERQRWGDTMAQYAETEDGNGDDVRRSKSSSKSKTKVTQKKPMYKGAAPPNRYQIRPGHRWDGVDRSNGFESEWFAARNRIERNKNLEYQWELDE